MPSQLSQSPFPLASSAVAATPQTAGRPAGAGKAQAPAEQRDTSVRLSAQALSGARDSGLSTVGAARQFMEGMAGALFGDAAQGAVFDFDALSLSASSGAGVALARSGDAVVSALSLNESAHFIGSGQLTLANGQTYDFEVEVKYQASAQAETVQVQSPDVILAGKQLPAIKYPSGIEDLFKLLGRELSIEQGDPGTLTLRLMRLVDRAALLAPRLPDEAAPSARRMAANAYASTGAASAEV